MPQHGHHRPSRNILAFWHMSRASRIYPRLKSWPEINDAIPVAFAGYKVGMTHAIIQETRENHLKNREVFTPITILEVPPLKVFGIRFYEKTSNGLRTLTDVISSNISEDIKRKIKNFNSKDSEKKLDSIDLSRVSLIKLLVHTQPRLSGIGKKKPEIFEIPVGGKIEDAFNYAKSILGKEIKINDVFKENELVDVISVTKGHGFEGAVKRHNIKILPRIYRGEKAHRRAGSKGAWGMRRIFPTTPMPGQYGFHRRTEYNKLILKISDDPIHINPSSGWPHYGKVKSTWIALKGSIPGPSKRLVILRKAIRPKESLLQKEIKILYLSVSPKN